MKKVLFIIIIAVLLCFILSSCDKPEPVPTPDFTPFTYEAGRKVFVQHKDFKPLTEIDKIITVGRYTLETINVREGLIVYSKSREDAEFDKAYAVKSIDGEEVIPFAQNSDNDIISLEIDNNIIVTRDRFGKYTVYDTEGIVIIKSIEAKNILSIDDSHIKVEINNENAQVYLLDGRAIFTQINMLRTTDRIVSAGSSYFINVMQEGATNIFDNLGFLVKYYQNTDTTRYSVNYIHNGKFLIVENIQSTSLDYDVLTDGKYIKQNVYIYDAARDIERKVSTDKIISDTANYYIEKTVRDINRAFTYIMTYNLNADKTVNSAVPYYVYIIDSNFNLCIQIADDVYPFIYFREEKGLENNGMNVRLIGLDGSILWDRKENINTVLGYNEDMLIAGKLVDNKLKYAAYDGKGNVLINYEYEGLSLFVGGYAIGYDGENYKRIDRQGNCELINKDIKAFNYLYGLYVTEEEGYRLLYSNSGQLIIGADRYAKSMTVYTDSIANTYVAVTDSSDILKVYVLK